jgi:hypothetical protein
MSDPRQIVEYAVASIPLAVLRQMVERFERYPTDAELVMLRASLAVEARKWVAVVPDSTLVRAD